MRVLFDQGVPVPLRVSLGAHQVVTAYELGWSALSNGELLAAAQQAGFETFVTTDTNLRYQQNLAGRSLAIVVLSTTSWPRIRAAADPIARRIATTAAGTLSVVEIP